MIKPLEDKVVVKPIEEVEKTSASGLIITKMEKEKKELEAQIKTYLGEATQGLLPDGTLRLEVSHRERRGIDTEALKTAFPEAYEATQTLSKYVVLVAK